MPASDQYGTFAGALGAPLVDMVNVTPNDSTDLTYVTRAIYVGVAGNVALVTKGGTDATFALAAGWHPIRVARVKSTGTTATGLIAGW